MKNFDPDEVLKFARALGFTENSYLEKHHFNPRSSGGTGDITNLVLISPELHYRYHHKDRLNAEKEIEEIYIKQQNAYRNYLATANY